MPLQKCIVINFSFTFLTPVYFFSDWSYVNELSILDANYLFSSVQNFYIHISILYAYQKFFRKCQLSHKSTTSSTEWRRWETLCNGHWRFSLYRCKSIYAIIISPTLSLSIIVWNGHIGPATPAYRLLALHAFRGVHCSLIKIIKNILLLCQHILAYELFQHLWVHKHYLNKLKLIKEN